MMPLDPAIGVPLLRARVMAAEAALAKIRELHHEWGELSWADTSASDQQQYELWCRLGALLDGHQ